MEKLALATWTLLTHKGRRQCYDVELFLWSPDSEEYKESKPSKTFPCHVYDNGNLQGAIEEWVEPILKAAGIPMTKFQILNYGLLNS